MVSAGGRYVAFYSDARNLVPGANPAGQGCLFLFDRAAGTVVLVARTGLTLQEDATATPDLRMSPEGRWLAFSSPAAGLIPGQRTRPARTARPRPTSSSGTGSPAPPPW